jgi:hypothetical protein
LKIDHLVDVLLRQQIETRWPITSDHHESRWNSWRQRRRHGWSADATACRGGAARQGHEVAAATASSLAARGTDARAAAAY